MANYFKGRGIQSIMNMDISEFMELTRPQLRQAVARLGDAANKRIKRLQASGLPSPAMHEILESGGKISTKGKSMNQLRAEFMRAAGFLKEQTSTITGAKKAFEDTYHIMNLKGIYIDKDNLQKLFNMYLEIRDKNPDIVARTLKYKLLRNVEIEVDTEDNASIETLTKRIVNTLNDVYNPGGTQYEGTAQFFEFE